MTSAVADATRQGAGAGIIAGGFIEENSVGALGKAAVARKLPLLALNTDFQDHALLAYQPYHARPSIRLAELLDKVLRGGNPSVIAFEQPESVKLVANRRIARAIGLEFPGEILLRATHVIES